jgi:hypothetical protein
VLPALAIGLQGPEQRNLASLAREGAGSLEEPLHWDILRRGFCTAAPAIVTYLAMRGAVLGCSARCGPYFCSSAQFADVGAAAGLWLGTSCGRRLDCGAA